MDNNCQNTQHLRATTYTFRTRPAILIFPSPAEKVSTPSKIQNYCKPLTSTTSVTSFVSTFCLRPEVFFGQTANLWPFIGLPQVRQFGFWRCFPGAFDAPTLLIAKSGESNLAG
jgi:hypothetical protein